MKKLSNITESIWSDLQDRSSGETVRKEDDVDLLDAQEFVEYLRDIYKNVDTKFYIFKDLNNMITVPTFETELGTKSTWFIEYDCNKKAVYIWEHFLNKEDKLFDKLNDNYKLTLIRRNFTENFLVEPKKGKSSNKFFIEIIDYILENASVFCKRILVKNNKVSESIWSDLQDRSSGEVVRKEDDVNNLDRDGFYKYIMEHYKTATEDVTGPYAIINSKNADYINIPIIEDDNNKLYRLIIWNFDNDGIIEAEKYITIPCREPFWGSKLFVKIRDNFKLEDKKDDGFNPLFKVWPKGIIKKTELNKFFLEVIDFIIDNAEEPFKPLLTRI